MSMMVNPARFGGAVVTDPHFSSVVLLVGFQGADGATITADEGPLAKGNAAVSGGAQLDTAQLKFGSSSALFDGSGDEFYYGDSADFEFGSGLFTIEFWFRSNDLSGAHQIIGRGGTSSFQSWDISTSGTSLRWRVSRDSGLTMSNEILAGTVSTGVWYHVALDYDGSKYRLYLAGSMVGSSATPRTLFNTPAELGLGNTSFGTSGLNGWLQEVRLTKGVARYASDSGLTVPTAPFPRS